MAQNRKYAALPDLDNAPDTYETPELTDGSSTLQTSTSPRSRSPSPISKRAVNPDISQTPLSSPREARSHFSSRISRKRRAHRANVTSYGRDDRRADVAQEIGDFSDEDVSDEESLERRVARLKREMEEVREEVGRMKEDKLQSEAKGEQVRDAPEIDEDRISALSNLLDGIALPGRQAASTAHETLQRTIDQPLVHPDTQMQKANQAQVALSPLDQSETPSSSTHRQALSLASNFDTRVTALESLLGMPTALGSAPTPPILPTLLNLSEKLSALNTTIHTSQSSSLDMLAQRVQQLAAEAESVPSSNRRPSPQPSSAAASDPQLTPELAQKITSLHALLPTLTHLSPTLPPLLERLRSLRRLHSEASSAAQGLEEVESRQGLLESEITRWREGLESLEGKVKEGEGSMGENVKTVEGWVRDLEGRMKSLGG
ncbi:MAG: hypothetical protein M4579_004076 [Chaenotheca gracillima]|nr:MAG: hypothetical protein M4579_004076 [Chaenotheca gracillima]